MNNIIKQLQIMSLAFFFAACNQIACSQRPADTPANPAEIRLLELVDEGTSQEALKTIIENPQIKYRTNKHDETALTLAAWEGNEAKVQILVDLKSNINHRNNNGATALFLAADQGHYKVVRLLIRANADPEIKNKHNITPLKAALKYRDDDAFRTLDELFLAKNNHEDAKPKRAECRGYGKALQALMNT
jgi:ankyrin repeat protein